MQFLLIHLLLLAIAARAKNITSHVKNLFLECSCLQARDHNGSLAMPSLMGLNASMARHAKNDCFLMFITASNEEIISLRLKHLQLRPNCLDSVEIFPYLRDPVVENTTMPEYIICNRTDATSWATLVRSISRGSGSSSSIIAATLRSLMAGNESAIADANANTGGSSGDLLAMSNLGHLAHLPSAITSTTTLLAVEDLRPNDFIYSSGKVFALRVRFNHKAAPAGALKSLVNWNLNVTAEYGFLKKENFKNHGRLIPGTFCDYYFFASPEATPQSLEIWKYFHSPRFPAKYPAHIKCSYKFIGRPETRVELIFEELHIPKQDDTCNLDKLTIFDAENANMNAVIDVLCGNASLGARHLLSTGPDLLIEFNASSNVTDKGFRGKFKFIQNNEIMELKKSAKDTDAMPFVADMYDENHGNQMLVEASIAAAKAAAAEAGDSEGNIDGRLLVLGNDVVGPMATSKKQHLMAFHVMDNAKLYKALQAGEGSCREIFDSRRNKTGIFDTNQLFSTALRVSSGNGLVPLLHTGRVECHYEFYASGDERVQIKFHDFHLPTESKNSTECRPSDALHLLTQVKGKYEVEESFCGAYLPKPIMSRGPKLMMQFVGKYPLNQQKVGYYGFRAEYTFLTNYGITTGEQLEHNCSFVYNSTVKKAGFFTSPNFPGLYPQNINCHYFFYGDLEEKVTIRFGFFDVEGVGSCGYQTASDYVEFSNFLSTDRKYPKYCGKRDKFEIRSDDRFFRVSFYSNDRFDRSGFRAYYEFEGKSTPSENTSMQSYVATQGGNSVIDVNKNYLWFLIAIVNVWM